MDNSPSEQVKLEILAFLVGKRLSHEFTYSAYLQYGKGEWIESDCKATIPSFNRESFLYRSTDQDVIFNNKLTDQIKNMLGPLTKKMKSMRVIISVETEDDISVSISV